MVFRRTLLVCAVAALLLSAGCLGSLAPTDDSDPDTEAQSMTADELVESAHSASSSVDSMHGTMSMTMNDGAETQSVTYDFWQRSPDAVRMEVVEADGTAGQPDVMVVNGSTTWTYDAEKNRAMKLDLGFSMEEMTEFSQSLNTAAFGGMEAERVGTDTVADRSATVVELTGNESGFMPETVTLWIDDETQYPLKYEMSLPGLSDGTMSMTYTDLTIDADISADRFTFDPPADADVVESDGLPAQTHEDVESAGAAVPFDLPEPVVPAEYTFDIASTSENLVGYSASLQYTAADEFLSVTVAESARETSFGAETEPITIGDAEATISRTEVGNASSVAISWTGGELTYRVTGTADEETLRSVAESIVE